MKKTGLNRCIYDFSVDYDTIAVDDILDIRNYLMKKNDIAYMLALIKRCVFTGFAFSSTLTYINMLSCINMLCVPDVVKNLNVKVFNLMSRTNGTRHIARQETCKCKCRLNSSVYNNKQCWNDDKRRCECEELIDKGVCDKGFLWSPSDCECYKSCDFSKYLDYKNCKCKKRLIEK